MSTGQRQRVKLAQAIAADPKFIVLDEPTDGLDPVQRDEMLNVIRQVNREFGIDVMLSSHVLEEVETGVSTTSSPSTTERSWRRARWTSWPACRAGSSSRLVDIVDQPRSIDEVEQALVAAGLTVERNGPVLHIGGRPEDELFDLAARSVAAAHGRIRRLIERRRSLDDLFSLHAERGGAERGGAKGRAAMSMRGDAQIAAPGFQPYDGPRSGVAGAIRSVSWESIRATLGIGQPARTKIFPVISVAIAYVPAIAFIGVAVLIPGDLLDPNEIADYAGYYGFITLAIILFSALVAPEVLVSDRRNGMLAMYLSTPLHRGTYLASKAIAVAATLGLVTLFPPILVLLGYTFDGSGPDGVGHWLITLLRIFVSGIAVSAALTSVSMAASSMTDRSSVRRDRHRA